MEKTAVFNLIILDESGSMSGCTKATISGCNETINVARNLQKKFADKQNTFISIYAFQSDGPVPSRYICKNEPIDKVRDITHKDYEPNGCTPLLDAVGSTLVDLKSVAATHEDALGIVTIITDGYENSSTHYNYQQVRQMISQLKELGWTFNFIGANIDVAEVSSKLNIDNAMAWTNDEEGTKEMFAEYSVCFEQATKSRIAEESVICSNEDRIASRKLRAGRFFKK